MTQCLRPLAAGLLLVICLTPIAIADTLVLKNGNHITCKILSETDRTITFELPYGKMTMTKKQIAEVIKEDEADYLRKSAEELISFRDLERGLGLLREAHKKDPESAETRNALVDALCAAARKDLENNKLSLASDRVNEAQSLDPESLQLEPLQKDLAKQTKKLEYIEQTARVAHRDGNSEAAYELLGQLLEAYPERREQWRKPYATNALLLGHAAVKKDEFEKARGFYRQALAHEPDLVEHLRNPLVYAELNLAIPLLKAQKFGQARKQLSDAHDLLPTEPALIYHLALACEGDGDLNEAAHLYEILAGPERRSINGKRHIDDLRRLAEAQLGIDSGTSSQVAKKPESSGAGDPGTLESKHFLIHHHNARVASSARRNLEHHYRRLERTWFIGVNRLRLRDKIEVHLYPDRASYLKESKCPEWSDGFARSENRYGLITNHSLHFNTAAAQFESATLPHELAHAVLPYRVGASGQIPLWLDEGVATTEEPAFKQAYYARQVVEAEKDNQLFPLVDLVAMTDYPKDETRVSLFYAQANSLARFLRERLGNRRFFPALASFIDLSIDQAVRAHTRFQNLGELERVWKRWIRRSAAR